MVTGSRNRSVTAVLMAALLAILVVACGSPQASAPVILTGEHQPVEVEVAPAQPGNINVTTSYAALVEATDLVDVAPLAQGRVEAIPVSVGSLVKRGQVVAELSHGALDAQLQQAQSELAVAKAAVNPDGSKAQTRLDAAQAVLDELLNPSSSDLQVAKSLVTKAQSNLDKAGAKSVAVTAKSNLDTADTMLDQLLNPLASSLQAAKSAAAAAQSKLDSAKTKLSQLLEPPESDLKAAEGAMTIAQSKLDSAETKLSQLINPPAPDLASAEEAVADSRTQLSAAQSELNLAISNQSSATWGTLLGARIALQANSAILDNPSLNQGLNPEEIADAEEAVVANQGQISILMSDLSSAPLLVADDRFNTSSLIPKEIRAGLWKESEAELALKTSLAQLQELQNPSQETMSLVENDVAIAEARLRSAQARVQDITNPSERTIALAQDQVSIAQAAFDSAQETLNETQNPSESTISLARNNVATAEAAFASAEAQSRLEIASAQADLDTATTNFDDLKSPRQSELAAAKAAVADAEKAFVLSQGDNGQLGVRVAQAKVAQVQQQLAETQVLAPFDGVITRIWLSVGAIASPRPLTPIVTVASGDALVSLRVEETEVGFFQEGQTVQFTSPGLPGGRLELKVDLVSPTGEEEAHTFLVQMSPVGIVPDLKPGLSGEVSISAGGQGVLLVPKDAVRRVGGQFSLFIVRDGQARSVEVDVGLVDANNMEILSGVRAGDSVVVSGQSRLSDTMPVTVAN